MATIRQTRTRHGRHEAIRRGDEGTRTSRNWERTVPADAFPTNEKVNGEQFARVDVGEQSPRLPPRAPEPASATAPRSLERWLLRKALAASGNPPVAVELWDGTSVAGSNDAVLHRFRI